MATSLPDFIPGDPAVIIGGKVEKPARVHGKQPPKPSKTARGISADIKHRMQVIEPLIEEYEVLKKLDVIFNPPPKKKRGRPRKDK